MRVIPFRYDGLWGAQIGRWQIDFRDHRRSRPLFSVRELGAFCGHHLGHYCLRVGRLRNPNSAPRRNVGEGDRP